MVMFADHLQAWLRGEDSTEALAGGVAVASLLEVARQKLIRGA